MLCCRGVIGIVGMIIFALFGLCKYYSPARINDFLARCLKFDAFILVLFAWLISRFVLFYYANNRCCSKLTIGIKGSYEAACNQIVNMLFIVCQARWGLSRRYYSMVIGYL